jgi:HK97 gp10 family phage protein
MAYSIQVTGMEELLNKMDKLPEIADKVAAEALYEGAGVVADQVSRAVHGIATKRFKYPAPPGKQRMPSPEEKAILENASKGISKFRKNGLSVSTSVGFARSGYGNLNGKTVPVPMIANAINSGTSFMKKQPFLRKAFSQSKSKATAAIEAGIQKRMKEFDIS